MGRRRLDEVDFLCERWAKTRREVVGLVDPLRASQYIGSLRSTFASVRDHRGGGTESAKPEQFYPEVYTGDALNVNRIFKGLPPHLKAIMDLHYTLQEPRDRRERARLVGLKREEYWGLVGRLKDRLGEYFGLDSVQTLAVDDRGSIRALP